MSGDVVDKKQRRGMHFEGQLFIYKSQTHEIEELVVQCHSLKLLGASGHHVWSRKVRRASRDPARRRPPRWSRLPDELSELLRVTEDL